MQWNCIGKISRALKTPFDSSWIGGKTLKLQELHRNLEEYGLTIEEGYNFLSIHGYGEENLMFWELWGSLID